MLKKTIPFKDLDGNDVVEDFYFNLTKAEIAELELSHKNGYSAHLKTVIATNDGGLIIATFKDLVVRSVGRRSEDGRRFIKNKEIADEFLQSEAYSEMFLALVTDANEGAAFVKAIMPADIVAQIDAETRGTSNVELPTPENDLEEKFLNPEWVPSKEDFMAMTPSQQARAFARKQ